MRIRTPLRPKGARAIRWDRWWKKSHAIVTMRCRQRCEATGMTNQQLDVHHLFGRSEPLWGWHPLALIAVTRHCHEDLTNELLPALHRELRWGAVGAIAQEFGESEWLRLTTDPGDEPLDVWRRLVDRLNGLGWRYDSARNAITREDA